MRSIPPERWNAPVSPASGQILYAGPEAGSSSGAAESEQFHAHRAAIPIRQDFRKENLINIPRKAPKHRTKDTNKINYFERDGTRGGKKAFRECSPTQRSVDRLLKSIESSKKGWTGRFEGGSPGPKKVTGRYIVKCHGVGKVQNVN
jgi:hypothetical protein